MMESHPTRHRFNNQRRIQLHPQQRHQPLLLTATSQRQSHTSLRTARQSLMLRLIPKRLRKRILVGFLNCCWCALLWEVATMSTSNDSVHSTFFNTVAQGTLVTLEIPLAMRWVVTAAGCIRTWIAQQLLSPRHFRQHQLWWWGLKWLEHSSMDDESSFRVSVFKNNVSWFWVEREKNSFTICGFFSLGI